MQSKEMIQALVTAVKEAVQEAFQVQLSSEVTLAEMRMDTKINPAEIEVMATLSLTSTKYIGSLTICFPGKTFLGSLNKMLGESYTEVTAENSDAAGEILNIIYGLTKTKVNKIGCDFAPALPTAIFGKNVNLSPTAYTSLHMEFKSEFGPLYLIFGLKECA